MYIHPEIKIRHQFYALCFERAKVTGKSYCANLADKDTIISHYQQVFKDTPISLPGQNQRAAHILTQTFLSLGYENKSIGTLNIDVRDGEDIYHVWGLTTHPTKQYSTLSELKEGITRGDVIVTGYLQKNQEYAKFINKINELKVADSKRTLSLGHKTYDYGVQTIRTVEQLNISSRIISISKPHYKYVDYKETGIKLDFKMNPNIIPFIDIHQDNNQLDCSYSDQMLIAINYLLFADTNSTHQNHFIRRLKNYKILGHTETLIEEAFKEYLTSPTTDDVDPNY